MQSAQLKCVFFYLLIALQSFAQTPQLVLQKGHLKSINAVAFNSNCKYILTTASDETAKIWDPFSGKLISELNGSDQPLSFAYFSPNNKYVATGAGRDYYFWNPATGDLLYKLKAELETSYEQLPFSPNGELIAVPVGGKNWINILFANTGKLYKRIKGFDDSLYMGAPLIKFLSDSTLLISSNEFVPHEDRSMIVYHVYNFIKDSAVSRFTDTDTKFSKADFVLSNTGRYLLCKSKEDMTYAQDTELWDIQQQKMLWRKWIDMWSASFSPDDSKILLVALDFENTVRGQTQYVTSEISLTDTTKHFRIRGDNLVIAKPCYSIKANFIATAYNISAYYDQDHNYLAKQYKIDIWNKSHTISCRFETKSMVTVMDFSHDEKYLVTGYVNGNYSVWDITDSIGKEVSTCDNIIDPVMQVHHDVYQNRMMYLTKTIYGSQQANTFNKLFVLENGELPVNKIHYTSKDRYSIMDQGEKLTLISNDSLSVIKKIDYHYYNGFVTIGKDSSIEEMGNRDIITKLKHHDLESLSIYSKPLMNNLGKNKIFPKERYQKDIPDVRFTYGSLKSRNLNDTILLIANTDNNLPVPNENLHGYIYSAGEYSNQISFIQKNDLSVSTLIADNGITNPIISNNTNYIFCKKYKNDLFQQASFVYCMDVEKKERFKTPTNFRKDSVGSLKAAVFSPDEKTVCIVSEPSNAIRVINAQTGAALYNLTGHSASVKGVEYTKDSKFLYSWSDDGTCKKWEIATGKLIYTYLFFQDHDYAVILPEGYYYISSRTDAKYLNFKMNGRLYNFSQFDLQYNRPDKVLQAMGSADKQLIQAYYKAWIDRITKSGFTEATLSSDQLHIPQVLIEAESIPSTTQQQELKLSFSLEDSMVNIKRYNIFVNDVPLNGIDGKLLMNPTHHTNISQTILLSEAENKIEVNCTNENGLESRKEVAYVKYKPQNIIQHKTYFIGIGINQYSAHSSFKDLNYCVKDIRDLSAAFKEKFRDELVIDTLIDSMATKENILALRQKLLQTNVDDKVIVSFSGHGMVDPNDQNEFYFVTGQTDVNNPAQNGISYAQLEDLLDSIPARKKLMLLDACHSGESDENELSNNTLNIPGIKRGADELNINNESSVQVISVASDGGQIKSGTTDIFKLMQEAFVDIRRNNGAYVISASQSNETAEENKEIKNGVFTHCLLEQIKQMHTINVNDLSININKCVSESTLGTQNTANRQELAEYNWQLW